jgi:hypothetical protein
MSDISDSDDEDLVLLDHVTERRERTPVDLPRRACPIDEAERMRARHDHDKLLLVVYGFFALFMPAFVTATFCKAAAVRPLPWWTIVVGVVASLIFCVPSAFLARSVYRGPRPASEDTCVTTL